MYEEFYHFNRTPFSKTPDPSFLYRSRGHEEALARLLYAVEVREFVVLTGEVGCGKTTITRALIDSLGDRYAIVLILNPCLSPSQFLKTIARRLELDTAMKQRDELMDMIYEKVYALNEQGMTPVIIIDEAHLIPKRETFEEVRLLTNFQLDDKNLVSLVLAGQPALRELILRDDFRALRQRIGLYYNLDPLSEQETGEYIRHRLALSGGDEMLFTDSALALIYRYAGGIPRLINSLATTALLEGVGKEAAVIDDTLVLDAARELMLNSTEPMNPAAGSAVY
ncbi:MAG: ExeA family protein [bacterium]